MHFSTTIAALLAASVTAAPTEMKVKARDDCTWDDNMYKGVPCDQFSVQIGGGLGKNMVAIDGYQWSSKDVVFEAMQCSGYFGRAWKSFTTPLPWTVDVYSGNAECGTDKVEIKYATVHIEDVANDTRCATVKNIISGNRYRCLIPINP